MQITDLMSCPGGFFLSPSVSSLMIVPAIDRLRLTKW